VCAPCGLWGVSLWFHQPTKVWRPIRRGGACSAWRVAHACEVGVGETQAEGPRQQGLGASWSQRGEQGAWCGPELTCPRSQRGELSRTWEEEPLHPAHPLSWVVWGQDCRDRGSLSHLCSAARKSLDSVPTPESQVAFSGGPAASDLPLCCVLKASLGSVFIPDGRHRPGNKGHEEQACAFHSLEAGGRAVGPRPPILCPLSLHQRCPLPSPGLIICGNGTQSPLHLCVLVYSDRHT
jgi:hypothetical protein